MIYIRSKSLLTSRNVSEGQYNNNNVVVNHWLFTNLDVRHTTIHTDSSTMQLWQCWTRLRVATNHTKVGSILQLISCVGKTIDWCFNVDNGRVGTIISCAIECLVNPCRRIADNYSVNNEWMNRIRSINLLAKYSHYNPYMYSWNIATTIHIDVCSRLICCILQSFYSL